MGSEGKHGTHLDIFFIPLIARGHMIPMLRLANFLADNGVRATMVTTPSNATFLRRAAEFSRYLRLLTVPFPDVGLPPGCETAFDLPAGVDKMKIFQAMQLLQQPVEQLLCEHRPDCLVGDITVPWTAGVAESMGIPHFQFAVNAFSDVVINNLVCDAEKTNEVVPGIPHRIEMRRSELPEIFSLMHKANMSNRSKSVGVILNSFFELEPDYVELVKGFSQGRSIWCAGPFHLLRNENANSKNNSWDRYKNWLDSKDTDSVLYVNFGSECCFGEDQLTEIAHGLDSSGQPFIWVVRGGGGGADTIEHWLPPGFRKNVDGGRGLVLTEWVPQAAILAHEAVGGYIVHCGWNSSIEAFGAGLPVITWPLQADQFINERLFVEVNGTGVRVSERGHSGLVGRENVREAVSKLFDGSEEAKERRRKAKEYGELARSAVVEGGSSYADITSCIQELTAIVQNKKAALRGLWTTEVASPIKDV